MEYEDARQYLLGKPEAVEDYPFGPQTAVCKVRGRLFAIIWLVEGTGRVNLKCDPGEALFLRDFFPAVMPGWHMNKRHWNTVILDGSIPAGELARMMDNSYALVVQGLPRPQRRSLEIAHGSAALYPWETAHA